MSFINGETGRSDGRVVPSTSGSRSRERERRQIDEMERSLAFLEKRMGIMEQFLESKFCETFRHFTIRKDMEYDGDDDSGRREDRGGGGGSGGGRRRKSHKRRRRYTSNDTTTASSSGDEGRFDGRRNGGRGRAVNRNMRMRSSSSQPPVLYPQTTIVPGGSRLSQSQMNCALPPPLIARPSRTPAAIMPNIIDNDDGPSPINMVVAELANNDQPPPPENVHVEENMVALPLVYHPNENEAFGHQQEEGAQGNPNVMFDGMELKRSPLGSLQSLVNGEDEEMPGPSSRGESFLPNVPENVMGQNGNGEDLNRTIDVDAVMDPLALSQSEGDDGESDYEEEEMGEEEEEDVSRNAGDDEETGLSGEDGEESSMPVDKALSKHVKVKAPEENETRKVGQSKEKKKNARSRSRSTPANKKKVRKLDASKCNICGEMVSTKHLSRHKQSLRCQAQQPAKNVRVKREVKTEIQIPAMLQKTNCRRCGKEMQRKSLNRHMKGPSCVAQTAVPSTSAALQRAKSEPGQPKSTDGLNLKNPRVACPQCGKEMIQKSIGRHLKTSCLGRPLETTTVDAVAVALKNDNDDVVDDTNAVIGDETTDEEELADPQGINEQDTMTIFDPTVADLNCKYEDCDFVPETHEEYWEHVQQHPLDSGFACPASGCSKTFFEEVNLLEHIRAHPELGTDTEDSPSTSTAAMAVDSNSMKSGSEPNSHYSLRGTRESREEMMVKVCKKLN